jgi:hypothetical protein
MRRFRRISSAGVGFSVFFQNLSWTRPDAQEASFARLSVQEDFSSSRHAFSFNIGKYSAIPPEGKALPNLLGAFPVSLLGADPGAVWAA